MIEALSEKQREQYFIKEDNNEMHKPVLHLVVEGHNTDMVDILRAYGANPAQRYNGVSALGAAIKLDKFFMLKVLLGDKPSSPEGIKQAYAHELCLAVEKKKNNFLMINELLEHGADPTAQYYSY